jgi:hypothetical protein
MSAIIRPFINIFYINVYKTPDDDSHLEPKHVTVNKLIKTGDVCDWFYTCTCGLLTPPKMSRLRVRELKARVLTPSWWVYNYWLLKHLAVSIFRIQWDWRWRQQGPSKFRKYTPIGRQQAQVRSATNEPGCAWQSVWTLRRTGKSLVPGRNWNPSSSHPVHNPVTTPTELSGVPGSGIRNSWVTFSVQRIRLG